MGSLGVQIVLQVRGGVAGPEDCPLVFLVNILHLLQILVSIDDEDRGRQRIFLVDQPALVKVVELLQILQRNLILLTAGSDVDSLQSLRCSDDRRRNKM